MEASGSISHLFLRTPATFFSSLIFSAIHACFTHLQPHFSLFTGECICHCHQCHALRSNCNSQPAGWVSVWHWGTGWCKDLLPRAPVAQPWKSAPVSQPYNRDGTVLFFKAKSWALKILPESLLLKITGGLALGSKSFEGKDCIFISCVYST